MSLLTMEHLKSTTTLFQYSEKELQEILKEFEKTPKNLLEDVNFVKNWLKTQPHLPHHPSDRQIASFLVNNKCSIEKTKQKIDMSFTIRNLIPDFYKDLCPKSKKIQEGFKYTNIICLPKLTKDLNRVIIMRYNPGNEVLDAETVLGFIFMLMEMMTLIDFVNGYEFIFDCTHVTFSLGAKFTPIILKKSIQVLEHVYSGRLKALRIVNIPKFLDFFLDIIMSLFKEKVQSRVEFLQGYDRIIEIYGNEFIPSELGGKAGSILIIQEKYKRLLESHNDYFETMQNMKIDENLRPQKLQNDDFLGYYGNFKKIDID